MTPTPEHQSAPPTNAPKMRAAVAEGLETFELANDPPAPRRVEFGTQERTKQSVLITGTKLLRGQLDLF